MSYRLGRRSIKKLRPVHPDLYAVVRLAITLTKQDFTVFEGMRTVKRQRQLVANGKSKTMNSRHLTGHAVDLVPWINGKPVWNTKACRVISRAVKKAARILGIPIEWGGNWRSFFDGPHFQLPRGYK